VALIVPACVQIGLPPRLIAIARSIAAHDQVDNAPRAGDEQIVASIIPHPARPTSRTPEIFSAIVNNLKPVIELTKVLANHPGSIAKRKAGPTLAFRWWLSVRPAIILIEAIVAPIIPARLLTIITPGLAALTVIATIVPARGPLLAALAFVFRSTFGILTDPRLARLRRSNADKERTGKRQRRNRGEECVLFHFVGSS